MTRKKEEEETKHNPQQDKSKHWVRATKVELTSENNFFTSNPV